MPHRRAYVEGLLSGQVCPSWEEAGDTRHAAGLALERSRTAHPGMKTLQRLSTYTILPESTTLPDAAALVTAALGPTQTTNSPFGSSARMMQQASGSFGTPSSHGSHVASPSGRRASAVGVSASAGGASGHYALGSGPRTAPPPILAGDTLTRARSVHDLLHSLRAHRGHSSSLDDWPSKPLSSSSASFTRNAPSPPSQPLSPKPSASPDLRSSLGSPPTAPAPPTQAPPSFSSQHRRPHRAISTLQVPSEHLSVHPTETPDAIRVSDGSVGGLYLHSGTPSCTAIADTVLPTGQSVPHVHPSQHSAPLPASLVARALMRTCSMENQGESARSSMRSYISLSTASDCDWRAAAAAVHDSAGSAMDASQHTAPWREHLMQGVPLLHDSSSDSNSDAEPDSSAGAGLAHPPTAHLYRTLTQVTCGTAAAAAVAAVAAEAAARENSSTTRPAASGGGGSSGGGKSGSGGGGGLSQQLNRLEVDVAVDQQLPSNRSPAAMMVHGASIGHGAPQRRPSITHLGMPDELPGPTTRTPQGPHSGSLLDSTILSLLPSPRRNPQLLQAVSEPALRAPSSSMPVSTVAPGASSPSRSGTLTALGSSPVSPGGQLALALPSSSPTGSSEFLNPGACTSPTASTPAARRRTFRAPGNSGLNAAPLCNSGSSSWSGAASGMPLGSPSGAQSQLSRRFPPTGLEPVALVDGVAVPVIRPTSGDLPGAISSPRAGGPLAPSGMPTAGGLPSPGSMNSRAWQRN